MNSEDLSISFASSLGINDAPAENTHYSYRSIDSKDKQRIYPKEPEEDLGQVLAMEMKRSSPSHQKNSYTALKEREMLSDQHITKSTPFSPMSSMWSKESVERDSINLKKENVSKSSTTKVSIDKLLEARFKSLPSSLEKTFEVKSAIQTTTQSANPLSRLQAPCIVEPTRIHFDYKVNQNVACSNAVQLKLKNTLQSTMSFSLFSSNGLLEFEMNEGTLLEEEEIEIKVQVKSQSIQQLQQNLVSDKILVLVNQTNPTTVDVFIDMIKNEHMSSRPKCPFCALEKGFPAHCL